MLTGAFRERLRNSWVEIRENLGRATLQALGVMLGVASVLGGFSISDSQRKRSDELYVRLGGFDKLNVQPSARAVSVSVRTSPPPEKSSEHVVLVSPLLGGLTRSGRPSRS